MDQESVVYGCIKDTFFYGEEREIELHRDTNRGVMEELPRAEDWPLISREMFAMPAPALAVDDSQTDVVHFGSSYKAVEHEWEQWLGKFEQMLKRMYWVSATVHLETELSGKHTFSWESTGAGHNPSDSELKMVCEWERESTFSTRPRS